MDNSGTSSWEQIVRQNYSLISLFIVLIAGTLRFYNLGGNSLWLDEAIYANVPLTDFGLLLEYTRHRNSSPIFLPYIYHLFGEGLRDPLLIRLPPAIFSMLSVGVLLAFPKTGVSRLAAVLAAFMLAISPIQVFYAQEVREYSLSVLMSCFMLFAFSGLIYKRTKSWGILFSTVLFFTPLTAYGTIFMALATSIAFLLICMRDHRVNLSMLLLPWLALLTGITITFHVTASYQMWTADAWYLARFFPPDGLWVNIPWLATSTLGWFGLILENQRAFTNPMVALIGGLVILLISSNVVITLVRKNGYELINMNLFLVLIILLGGSVIAALIGVYPLGGIRQHLYAAPLITLCVSQSVISVSKLTRGRYTAITLILAILLYSAASFIHIPRQYREIQDIVSAISNIKGDVNDESVYIYYMAIQAVDFHYPNRKFTRGSPARYQIEVMGNEIIERIQDCHVSVVFTHVWKTEDEEIIAYLKESGLTLFEEHTYAGARVLNFTSCELE